MPKIGDRFNPHRMFDGAFIPECICQYRGLSPGAKLAYGRFCRFAGKNGEVFPSMATMGREIGCSESQARSYVKELIDAAFVEIERESGRVNTYYFLWHPAFDGDIGMVRFSPPPQDATGVDTPSGCYRGVPQDATVPPPQDARPERELLEENQKRESNPPTPLEPENPEPAVGKFSDGSEYDPETGEEITPPTRFKKQWGRKKEPKPTPRSDRLRQLRESAYRSAGEGIEMLLPVRSIAEITTSSPLVNFPARWNELVPERPIDPELMPKSPAAYRESVFIRRFDEICEAARKEIIVGSSITYSFLLGMNKNGQYFWQQLLAGDIGYMNPSNKASGKNGKGNGDFVDRMKKEFGL